MVNITGIDLNLLLVFEALYQERHVGRAAQRVGLSQPAASSALARLRELFEDRLFIRGRLAMTPTPRADQLAPPIQAGLLQIRRAFEGERGFESQTSQRKFRLAMTDLAEWQLLPVLAARFAKSAPEIRIHVQRLPALFAFPEVEFAAKSFDLAIGFLPDPRSLPGSVLSENLFEDRNVVVARKGHPQLRNGLDFELFASLSHAAVIYRSEGAGIIDSMLAARGKQRRLCYASPHFAHVLHVVAKSDMIACLPEQYVQGFVRELGLKVFPAPIDLPAFTTRMLWERRLQEDSGHRWLRQQILDCSAALR
jgi:DNA-binding transcriptional LysR family regulator